MQDFKRKVSLLAMFGQVDTKVPSIVEEQVQSIYHELFPQGNRDFVPRSFAWAQQCFSGHYENYQAVDAKYHDFEHTLQGTLCLAQLLCGRHKAGVKPVLSVRMFELGIAAILFHDSGYLKKREDQEGTGAKYTLVHVDRSAAFAKEFLSRKGFTEDETRAVQGMIRCTGVNAQIANIPFRKPEEVIVGEALATADLLGQMAAEDYVDKLPVLFLEFAEAAAFEGGDDAHFAVYKTPNDLLRNSPNFWEDYVKPRIENDFHGLYKFLNQPYPHGPNPYLLAIEKNMVKIRAKLASLAKP